ncbi:peptidylprolyl isomerase fpr3 [Coemansia javaensis]|uniref:FK506-binding protein n=1 Tax=Coemansia javaensis TaxID=2761396 RepID=A0A9W8H7I3_9FUNG|nr:peptidylprolyl isomerase fpr3 [Coemansia javaensis]
MLRGFWGLKIAPGKTYSQTVDASFRVSGAALGATLADEGRTSVVLTIDEKSFVLCSLTPGGTEQHLLDLSLTEGEEITFETQGNNEVHLTGNFIDDAPDSSDDEDDGEGGLDLSKATPEEIEELIGMGIIKPEDLLAEDDSDDEDYDSEDAALDGRIEEITEEEEAALVDGEDEDEDEEDEDDEEEAPQPVTELKIKKQAAEKKRKAAEAAAEAEAEAEAAAAAAKGKKAKKDEAKKDATPKKEAPKKDEPKTKTMELAGGVTAEVMKEGAGPGAKKGARVGMYYIGKLTNGKVFDKNTKGKPFWFRLGAGEVIKGWDVGIAGMKKGGERRLTIPAAMAYGKRGAPPDIPPNATLVFDIRLVEFK